MDKALMVFIGAGLGGVARFWLGEFSQARFAARLGEWPVGTLAVNVIGSLLIGIVVVLAGDHHQVKHLAIVGFLGGFTTFSSFSRDTVELVGDGRHGAAAIYVALSLLLCVGGAWLGMILARSLVSD